MLMTVNACFSSMILPLCAVSNGKQTYFQMILSLKSKLPRLILLFLIHQLMQGNETIGFAPPGCSYTNGIARCQFHQWTPPLQDNDFGPETLLELHLHKINGTVPAGAFSGLSGPLTPNETYLYLHCILGGTTKLSRDLFTENLHWVKNLRIFHCYLEGGLPSRLLYNLKRLKNLIISGTDTGIEGLVADNTLAGLTNLQELTIQASVKNGILPHGLFDGLMNLTKIDLRNTKLHSIPPNWFNGLVRLETIQLSNNDLQTLPRGIFDGLESLKTITLNGNPWNCSCELEWLQDWTHLIINGMVCQDPPVLKSVKFKDAVELFQCISAAQTILSTSVSFATKIAVPHTAAVTVVVASSTLHQTNAAMAATSEIMEFSRVTVSQTEWILSTSNFTEKSVMPVTSTAIPLIFKATSETPPAESATFTLTNVPNLTASFMVSTANQTEITKSLFHWLSFQSTMIFSWQTMYTSTARALFSTNRGSSNDGIAIDFRKIYMVSGIGAFAVLFVVGTGLYCCVCRNKRYRSVTGDSNGEEERTEESNPKNAGASGSSSASRR